MDKAALAIIGSECKSACEGESDFETRIRKAMKVVAKGHWMYSGDDLLLRGALAGVMLASETTEEEKEDIKHTLEGLRTLNAMLSGVPVDLEAFVEKQEERKNVPLIKWWNEAKAA